MSISSGSATRSRLASWSSGQRSGSPRCRSARCQRESPCSTLTVMGNRRIVPGGGGWSMSIPGFAATSWRHLSPAPSSRAAMSHSSSPDCTSYSRHSADSCRTVWVGGMVESSGRISAGAVIAAGASAGGRDAFAVSTGDRAAVTSSATAGRSQPVPGTRNRIRPRETVCSSSPAVVRASITQASQPASDSTPSVTRPSSGRRNRLPQLIVPRSVGRPQQSSNQGTPNSRATSRRAAAIAVATRLTPGFLPEGSVAGVTGVVSPPRIS